MKRPLVGIAVVLIVWGVPKGYWAVQRAMLPALGAAPTETERVAWLAYEATLQCRVLDPCLTGGGPMLNTSACAQAKNVLASLQVPPTLPPAVKKNAEFVRAYWLSDLDQFVRGKRSIFAHELDTCTAESIPARLDRHFGIITAGSGPAHCTELTALLAKQNAK